MEHIILEEQTFSNLIMDDKSLSAAIGGATGLSVGADEAAYTPNQNFLITLLVLLTEGNPDLAGCASIAGSSIGALGFATTTQYPLFAIFPMAAGTPAGQQVSKREKRYYVYKIILRF
jgi:hypothetical protein